MRPPPTAIRHLYEPAASHAALSSGLVTNLMLAAWERRADLRQAFPLTDVGSVFGFVNWYARHGGMEYRFADAALPLDKPAEPLRTLSAGLVTQAIHLMWRARPDLHDDYPLRTRVDVLRFLQWLWSSRTPSPLLVPPTPMQKVRLAEAVDVAARHRLWAPKGRLRAVAAELHAAATLRALAALRPKADPPASDAAFEPDGVNVLGYITGVFGLGEQGRAAAAALIDNEVPVAAVDYTSSGDPRGTDSSLDPWLRVPPRFAVNLIELAPSEMVSLIVAHGDEPFRGRYNIGHWPWELPRWPAEWQMPLDLVDEIWAASTYAKEAFEQSTDRPVLVMPVPVVVPETPAPFDRAHFGLPDKSFLFLAVFDALSSIERKNPLAAVRAFQRAFPSRQDVGLVLKTMVASADHPHWSAVLQAARHDPRIRIIDAVLRRDEIWALKGLCDVFVSLHRSEGFGLSIAEAMALGRPAIATGYSANTDFMTADNSCLVRHGLCPVNEGDYFSWQGQSWADPDADHAAELMLRLFEDAPLRERLGANAGRDIRKRFSPATLGRAYRARLDAITRSWR